VATDWIKKRNPRAPQLFDHKNAMCVLYSFLSPPRLLVSSAWIGVKNRQKGKLGLPASTPIYLFDSARSLFSDASISTVLEKIYQSAFAMLNDIFTEQDGMSIGIKAKKPNGEIEIIATPKPSPAQKRIDKDNIFDALEKEMRTAQIVEDIKDTDGNEKSIINWSKTDPRSLSLYEKTTKGLRQQPWG
jgi:hypothetical protein